MRRPRLHDRGDDNNSVELFNLLAATKRYFWKNVYLVMDRDGADPTKGSVQFEMDAVEDKSINWRYVEQGQRQHFVMVAIVRGFDIEAMSGLPLGTGPGGGISEAADGVGWVLESDRASAPPASCLPLKPLVGPDTVMRHPGQAEIER